MIDSGKAIWLLDFYKWNLKQALSEWSTNEKVFNEIFTDDPKIVIMLNKYIFIAKLIKFERI